MLIEGGGRGQRQHQEWRITWMRTSATWRRRTRQKKLCRDGGSSVDLWRTRSEDFASLRISPRDLKRKPSVVLIRSHFCEFDILVLLLLFFFKKSQNKNPTSNVINFTVLITFSCVSFRQQLLIDIQIQSVVLFPLPGTWSCWFTHVFRLLDCLCFKTPWGYSFCFHLNHANLMLSIYSFSLKG